MTGRIFLDLEPGVGARRSPHSLEKFHVAFSVGKTRHMEFRGALVLLESFRFGTEAQFGPRMWGRAEIRGIFGLQAQLHAGVFFFFLLLLLLLLLLIASTMKAIPDRPCCIQETPKGSSRSRHFRIQMAVPLSRGPRW